MLFYITSIFCDLLCSYGVRTFRKAINFGFIIDIIIVSPLFTLADHCFEGIGCLLRRIMIFFQ